MTVAVIALYFLVTGFTVRDACERLRSSKLTCLIFGILWPIYWITFISNK